MQNRIALVVDDEHSSRLIAAKQCEALGLAVIFCTNGRIAHEVLLENPHIALVITDVDMPELDGRSLVQRIRSTLHLRDIPVVFMSGAVTLNHISELLRDGVDRFLPKPIDVSVLSDYIKRLTNKPRSAVVS